MGDTDQPAQPVLIALGSNLGDRANTLSRACQRLAEHGDIEDLSCSAWHATSPVGGPAQGEFLNGAAFFRTTLSPWGVFSLLQDTERELGRETVERWGPRVIDLDLLLYADEVIDMEGTNLVIPHPRMAFRNFVLQPANEVASQMRHPVIGWTIAELWRHLQICPPYIGFALGDPKRSQRLLQQIADSGSGRRVTSPPFAAFASLPGVIAEVLWCSPNEPTAGEIPDRPKIVVCDGNTKASVVGPIIDVSKLSDDQAAIEIAAAIAAMRE